MNVTFIRNETRKTGKEKGEKNYLDLSGIMYFFGTLIRVLGALQADLSLELAGEEKCIVSNHCSFAASRFAAINSHKRTSSQATAYPDDMIN